MIGKKQFEVMKPGMRIVNCARGGIIDEIALVDAIDAGIVAGAAFDVFEVEPPAEDHPFLTHPKIIVTPHLGASTVEAQENVAIDVSEQVLHILRNEPFINAVNMPPIPANLRNILQPYFVLGEKLGSFIAQSTEGAVTEIVVGFAGELAEVDSQPLTRHIVRGVLAHHLGSENVNVVNSMHLAKERDVNIVIQKSHASKDFTNLVTVSLRTKKEERVVSGTLLTGYGPRIVQIDKYPVDVTPEGNLILISHNDKPGIIGRVGTLLGNNDVNIATMQVGRQLVGGSAIMVLRVDKVTPKDVLVQLTNMPELNTAKEIKLF
jgi:D-3-phosphoglycerate dehydrogenase